MNFHSKSNRGLTNVDTVRKNRRKFEQSNWPSRNNRPTWRNEGAKIAKRSLIARNPNWRKSRRKWRTKGEGGRDGRLIRALVIRIEFTARKGRNGWTDPFRGWIMEVSMKFSSSPRGTVILAYGSNNQSPHWRGIVHPTPPRFYIYRERERFSRLGGCESIVDWTKNWGWMGSKGGWSGEISVELGGRLIKIPINESLEICRIAFRIFL